MTGNTKALSTLIAFGGSIELVDIDGWTRYASIVYSIHLSSLFWAVNNGHLDCVVELLRLRAQHAIADKEGKTPMDYAKTDQMKLALECNYTLHLLISQPVPYEVYVFLKSKNALHLANLVKEHKLTLTALTTLPSIDFSS
jgi:hypothetical protein